jgi:DNA-binding PadR family transcriptional regulator
MESKHLEDEGLLETEYFDSSGKKTAIGIRITSKGKKALETIYNPEWVEQQEKEKQEEKELRKREVESSESSNKFTKIGVISAIIISIVSLIVSILKP